MAGNIVLQGLLLGAGAICLPMAGWLAGGVVGFGEVAGLWSGIGVDITLFAISINI
ncbi:MAG: hypothetical protein ACOC3E_01845 [Cyanobacteriota bacterium]